MVLIINTYCFNGAWNPRVDLVVIYGYNPISETFDPFLRSEEFAWKTEPGSTRPYWGFRPLHLTKQYTPDI